MVQQFTQALQEAVKQVWEFVLNFAPQLALASGLLAIIALVLYLRDREGFERFGKTLVSYALGVAIGLLVVASLWVEVFLLGVAKETLLERQTVEAGSPYAAEAEAPVGTLYQYGPVAAYLQERTFTRTTTLPAQMITKEQIQQYLAPSVPLLEEPTLYMPKAPKVEVTVRRVGEELLLTRKVTMIEEIPITFDRARVHARFEIRRGARNKHYYYLTFEGHYTFRNPLDVEVPGRFVFPLPEPPGTIEGFQLTVGHNVITQPDRRGYYSWEGSLPPQATLTAVVKFRATAGIGWYYDIGSGRRRTGDFQLVVESDRSPRLLRRSLFPTEQRGNRMVWHLQNVITSQRVALAFPVDMTEKEVLVKILSFYPVALGAFVIWIGVLALLGMLRVPVPRVLGAVLGMGFGFLATPVLLGYLPLMWAIVLGTVLAGGLSLGFLTRQQVLICLLPAVSPLAFLAGPHSALLLAVIAIAALATLWFALRVSVQRGG